MPDQLTFAQIRFPEDGSVLDDLSLDLGVHERLAVFGPNGAGKSTLLRAIAGTLNGRERRNDIAYLPQAPYMFRGTARANLMLGRSDSPSALSLADQLGIAHLLDGPAQDLSGGEAQRLAIARVLGGDEPVVLMDEPLAPIDGVDRSAIAAIIRSATEGRALVCVSHSVDNAVAIAENLLVMDGGRIVQRGPVSEVLAEPADETVARLVGIANVVEGSVTAVDGALASVAVGSLVVSVPLGVEVGSSAVLRIPAETISVFSEEPHGASPRTVVRGTVSALLPRGSVVEVVMDGEPGLVALVTVGALDALGITEGSTVWFGLKATAIDVVRAG